MGFTKTLLTFIAGAAVGAIAGILLAPDKGSATRQKLVDKTNDLADSVKSKVDSMKSRFATSENDDNGVNNETAISESGNTTAAGSIYE